MPSSPNEDLPEAVALFLLGMAVPVGVAALAYDMLALYLSGTAYTVLAAAAFAVLAWAVLDAFEFDRPNFAVASVVGPLLFFVAVVAYGVATSGRADFFRYLFHDYGYMAYPAAFGAGGLLAVAVSRQYRNVAARRDRLPPARTAVVGLGALAVVALVVVLGANLAAAQSVAVESVEPGVVEILDPTLNVTLADGPADVRVTVVAPGGEQVTKRLTRAETRGGATVPVRLWFEDSAPDEHLPAQAGTYRVEVRAVSGVLVDTATFEAPGGRSVAVSDTAIGTDAWPGQAVPETTQAAGADTGEPVRVVVENVGTFHAEVAVALETPAGVENYRSFPMFLGPGDRAGVLFGVPEDDLAAIRADHGGRVTVRVVRAHTDDTVATAGVELPDSAGS